MMHSFNAPPVGLDEDLRRLLADMDVAPVRIEGVASPRSPRREPGAFRLRLADGRHLKATITTSNGHAKKVEYLLGCLDERVFPRVLARCGRVIVVEWVEGAPLDADATPDQLREAAALQAVLHLTPVPANCRYPAKGLDVLEAKIETDVRAAADLEPIGEAGARAALEAVRRFAPNDCGRGFVHRDFCPENLVILGDGRLCAIDNETVSLGPFEFDLARTWYRWPMDAVRRRIYLEAYARRLDAAGRPSAIDSFLDRFPFWAVAVLADSVQLRRAAPGPVLCQPVERLRALLEALARGAAPRELVFET